MKKYILILFLSLYPCSTFFAMDIKADSQKIVIAKKNPQSNYKDYLEKISFRAFHPHEINPIIPTEKNLATNINQPSLYGRFGELDITYMILEYLSPQYPERLDQFPTYTRATQEESELIKDALRRHYWLQGMHKTAQESKKYRDLIERASYMYNIALYNATNNVYGKDNLEIAALALACGANINKEACMSCPLNRAAENNLYTVSKMLLRHGASSLPYSSPLLYAVKNDNVPMTKIFMDHGIKMSNKNDSLMHTAARMNAINVIKYLHGAGYNINEKDKDLNCTSLHAAAHCKSYQAITTLLKLGADPSLKDVEEKTYEDILTDKSQNKLNCSDVQKFK
jgi:Ankyrin repeats (3 copies)